jgi:hypothetical protein
MVLVPTEPTRRVVLQRVPTGLYSRYTLHVEAVEEGARRAIDGGAGPADSLQRALALVERFRRFRTPNRNAYAQALTAGAAAFDLALDVPDELTGEVVAFLHAMEELDRLSKAKEVDLPAAPADIVAFRRWLVGEAQRQLEGEEPLPYAEDRMWAPGSTGDDPGNA